MGSAHSHAPVAQLDSASASEAEGCGFEPRRVYYPISPLREMALFAGFRDSGFRQKPAKILSDR